MKTKDFIKIGTLIMSLTSFSSLTSCYNPVTPPVIEEPDGGDDIDDGEDDETPMEVSIKSIGISYALNHENTGILLYTSDSRNQDGFIEMKLNHSDGTIITESESSRTAISRAIVPSSQIYSKDITIDGLTEKYYYSRFIDGSIDIIDESKYVAETKLNDGTVKRGALYLERDDSIPNISSLQTGKNLNITNFSSYGRLSLVYFNQFNNDFLAYDLKDNSIDVIELCDFISKNSSGNLEFRTNVFNNDDNKYSPKIITLQKLDAIISGEGVIGTYDSLNDWDLNFNVIIESTSIDSYVLARVSDKTIYAAAVSAGIGSVEYVVPFGTRNLDSIIPGELIDISVDSYVIFTSDTGRFSIGDNITFGTSKSAEELNNEFIYSLRRYDIE